MKSQNIKLDDFDQLTRLLTDDLKETPRSALKVLTVIEFDRVLKGYVDEFVLDQGKRDPYVGIERLEIVRRKTRRILELTEWLSRLASTPEERTVACATLRLLAAITPLTSREVEVSNLKVDVLQYALNHALDVRHDYLEMSERQLMMIHKFVTYGTPGANLITAPDVFRSYVAQKQAHAPAVIRQIVKLALQKGGDDEIC